jgi:hypothetical protein
LRGTRGGDVIKGSRGGSAGDTMGAGGTPAVGSSDFSSGGSAGGMTGIVARHIRQEDWYQGWQGRTGLTLVIKGQEKQCMGMLKQLEDLRPTQF